VIDEGVKTNPSKVGIARRPKNTAVRTILNINLNERQHQTPQYHTSVSPIVLSLSVCLFQVGEDAALCTLHPGQYQPTKMQSCEDPADKSEDRFNRASSTDHKFESLQTKQQQNRQLKWDSSASWILSLHFTTHQLLHCNSIA
jgi:hypothetical protein